MGGLYEKTGPAPRTMMYTTTSLAEILGVHTSTIYRWEVEGVIPEAQRNSAGTRLYSVEDVEALKQVAHNRLEAWNNRSK